MRTIRWGMIGCGAVTEVKSGPGLYKANHSTLQGVFSLHEERAVDYAKRHGVPKVYASVEEMMSDAEIDAVYVATPPAFHKQYALLCSKHGKVAYVEKPMADRYEDCLEMIRAAELAQTPLYVAFYRRAMDRFIKIKELLDQKAIGEVRIVQVTQYQPPQPTDFDRDHLPWRLLPQIAGGGKFLDSGIHVIDMMDFLFGPMEEVRGIAGNQAGLYEVEDIVTALWRSASGVLGTGSWGYTCFEYRDEVVIEGSTGRIRFAFFSDQPVYVHTKEGIRELHHANPVHVQQPFIQTIVEELNGVGKCPGDAASAARATRTVDQILAGYRQSKGF